jgi:malonyl CoA-acyl carrier protein transacylase
MWTRSRTRTPDAIRETLVKQVISPVRWEDGVREMLAPRESPKFHEIGPGKVLRGLMKRIDRKVECVGTQLRSDPFTHPTEGSKDLTSDNPVQSRQDRDAR